MSSTMNERSRILEVESGVVDCIFGKKEPLEKCRFCVHSKKFRQNGIWRVSPARAYCTFSKNYEEVDFNYVDAVECDDLRGEGFRSIMNIIS